jgi:hypothetical protein
MGDISGNMGTLGQMVGNMLFLFSELVEFLPEKAFRDICFFQVHG